jgi:hypothetical protein
VFQLVSNHRDTKIEATVDQGTNFKIGVNRLVEEYDAGADPRCDARDCVGLKKAIRRLDSLALKRPNPSAAGPQARPKSSSR